MPEHYPSDMKQATEDEKGSPTIPYWLIIVPFATEMSVKPECK